MRGHGPDCGLGTLGYLDQPGSHNLTGREMAGIPPAGLASLKRQSPGGLHMHTHDMENHDNLYADEVVMRDSESPADANAHAIWAVALIAAMVMGLGISLTLF